MVCRLKLVYRSFLCFLVIVMLAAFASCKEVKTQNIEIDAAESVVETPYIPENRDEEEVEIQLEPIPQVNFGIY